MALLTRPASTGLFSTLSDRFFAPLSSLNRGLYWQVLCVLYDQFFGPELDLPPINGFSQKRILSAIEEAVADQSWQDEEGAAEDTSRGYSVLNKFIETGWLRAELHGVEKTLVMPPAVSRFLSILIDFVEAGPTFLSGKIRSIDLLVSQVAEHKAYDALNEAALQSRMLLEYIRNTGTNIRELMAELRSEESTAAYVRRFFTDYVSTMFIGDYRELRTTEHPLSRRPQILEAIQNILENPKTRTEMVAWYSNSRNIAAERAEQLFNRDCNRIMELRRIDEYLERLDDELRRANRKALIHLDYHMRSLRPMDHFIRDAIQAVKSGDVPIEFDPFPAGEMISAERLAQPRQKIERPPAPPLRKEVPTVEQIASSNLINRAIKAREVNPLKVAQFLAQNFAVGDQVESVTLELNSPSAIAIYQALANVHHASAAGPGFVTENILILRRGFITEASAQEEDTSNSAQKIQGQPFVIKRRRGVQKQGRY